MSTTNSSVGGATLSDGSKLAADHQLAGGPSVLFNTVLMALSNEGAATLKGEATAVAWTYDACAQANIGSYQKDLCWN